MSQKIKIKICEIMGLIIQKEQIKKFPLAKISLSVQWRYKHHYALMTP